MITLSLPFSLLSSFLSLKNQTLSFHSSSAHTPSLSSVYISLSRPLCGLPFFVLLINLTRLQDQTASIATRPRRRLRLHVTFSMSTKPPLPQPFSTLGFHSLRLSSSSSLSFYIVSTMILGGIYGRRSSRASELEFSSSSHS